MLKLNTISDLNSSDWLLEGWETGVWLGSNSAHLGAPGILHCRGEILLTVYTGVFPDTET